MCAAIAVALCGATVAPRAGNADELCGGGCKKDAAWDAATCAQRLSADSPAPSEARDLRRAVYCHLHAHRLAKVPAQSTPAAVQALRELPGDQLALARAAYDRFFSLAIEAAAAKKAELSECACELAELIHRVEHDQAAYVPLGEAVAEAAPHQSPPAAPLAAAQVKDAPIAQAALLAPAGPRRSWTQGNQGKLAGVAVLGAATLLSAAMATRELVNNHSVNSHLDAVYAQNSGHYRIQDGPAFEDSRVSRNRYYLWSGAAVLGAAATLLTLHFAF